MPCDETEGRFADVAILQCTECGQLWLRYAVEYEAFPRSGRWARGLIDEASAQEMRSEAAADFLAALPGYVFGGSWFGRVGAGSGPMYWGV